MFSYRDRGEFALLVDNKDIKIGADSLISCTIIEDAKGIAPSINISFVDMHSATEDLAIFQDGVPMTVIIGDGKGEQPLQYKFRQWSIKNATINTAGSTAEINGVADLVPWLAQNVSKAHKGTAGEVVKKLAKEGGIKLTDVTNTNDKMTWLPDGRTIGSFVRNLMDHAWIGEGKCPHLAVTSEKGQWKARVKDIMSKGSTTQSFASAGLARSSDITIWDYRLETNGGPLNTYTTFGHKIIHEKMDGKVDKWSNFKFSPIVSQLGINSDLQSAMQIVRTFFHPPEVTETHDNYVKALHNNRMARSTFSVTIMMLTDQVSHIQLMDDIDVKLASSSGDVNQAYSGTYKVTGINRHISKGGQYVEKITASSQGTSDQNSGSSGQSLGQSSSSGKPLGQGGIGHA